MLVACAPTGSQNAGGKYTEIAKCLTEKGVKFYGAYWCPHCADQKKIFGDDMKYINYVECDPKGENSKAEECKKVGVERYPTWFFPGQGLQTGVTDPKDLAIKANCLDASAASQMSTSETAPSPAPTPAATTTQATQQ